MGRVKEAHEKLLVKDKSGTVVQCGFGLPTSGTNINQYFQVFAMQNGMENFIDEAEDKILFDQPEAVEALEFMKELKISGLWNGIIPRQTKIHLKTEQQL